MKKKLRFSAAVVFLFSMTPLAHAQQSTVDIPHTISYQGVIQSTAGMPLTGSQLITIRLYGDSAGMDLTWEDAFTTNVQNGVFNLLLGSQKPLPATSLMDMPLWIGVSIGEGEAMKPYAPLSASPYALTVANGSITAEKISADYVGSISINGTKVTGNGSNINLMASSGLQLSYDPVSSDIWLSAAEGGGSTGKGANTEGSSSIIGTNNEVFANGTYGSAQSGDVTLTTPQAIATSSSPTFANLTLSSNASISGTLGVTGATTTHGVTNTGDVSTGTIHTTGLATLNSASITNDATVGGTLNMSNQQIQNVASPTASADAATKAYADNINSTVTTSLAAETARAEAAEATKLSLAGGTVTGSLTTEGAITTGNSITIDGTTSPRSILGDITTEISTSSGDLLLDPAGNVGIGTATPAYSLDVNGTFRVTDAATLSSSVSIGGALNLNSHQINNVSDPTSAQDAATKNYADNLNATQTSALNSEISRAEGAEGTLTTNLGDEVTRAETAETANSAAISTEASRAEGAEATKLPLVGGTMTGSINMNSNSITNMLDPINPQDAATKNYVDNGIAAATGNNYIKNGTSLQSSSNFNIDGNGTIGGSFLANGSSAATPASGAGTRLMWSPSKGALRAGTANGTEWNDANIGSNSTAFGNGTTASGQYAFAAGQSTIASGPNGAAAFGNNTWSTGQADFAAGWYNAAGSVGSAVFGITNTAYGYASFAAGLGNHADDPWSTTLGQSASSNGYSGGFVFGDGGGTQTVITANDANYQFMARATGGFKFFADVTSNPGLTLNGSGNLAVGGSLLVSGTAASTPASGAGTRLMWSPAKGALRAGTANGTEWNDANIGSNSAAFGNGTTASGQYAFAAGQSTIASGPNGAAAFGNNTWSTGQADFAAGWYNVAGSVGSAVFGITNTAYGYASFAAGLGNHADDPWSTTLGQSASSNGYSGGFVFGDGGGTQTVITANDANYQFMARATGGFKFFADVSSTPGLTLSGAGNLTLGGTLNMNTNPINNVADPTNPQDAATKNYVDTKASASNFIQNQNASPQSGASFSIDGSGAVGTDFTTGGSISSGFYSDFEQGGVQVLFDAGNNHNLFVGFTNANNYNGSQSTYVGSLAGQGYTGIGNTFVGSQAGRYSTSGNQTTLVGSEAGFYNSGSGNTFIGEEAGTANTSGNNNTFLGYVSGNSVSSGNNNTFLGCNAGGSNSLTNATAIGASADVTASNSIQLGNTSVTLVNTSAAINTTTGFLYNGGATNASYLRGNGTNFVSSAIQASDVPTLNQNTTGTASNITGIVAIANGGTNGTASPTSGAVAYGTGTGYAFTAAGTTGQVLTSAGSGTPTWTTLPASLSGSGTANTIPKFTGSSTIGNSAISDNGSTVSVTNSESVLFSGTWTGTGNPPTSSTGAIFEWIPSLGALRAGVIDNSGSSDWSTANIGLYSNAFGYDTKASGLFATAFGANTTASGQNSTALGYNTTASNTYATALGYQSQATGQYSTAMGATALASGNYSTAIGWFAQAAGIASFAAGFEATAYNNYSAAIGYQVDAYGTNTTALGTNASTNFENGSFIYGDGSAYVSSGAANSFTVLASGGTTFYSNSAQTAGVAFPANGGLTITGSASPITLDGHGVGTSGQVLASAGAGATPTWATVRKNWVSVPSSSSASGTAGDEAYDSNYLYICVSANTWERVGLSSW